VSGGLVHAMLIEAAAKWLAKCHSVVITDMVSATGETPDAIGWAAWHSTLIECKASRADFMADADKRHRRDGQGMGDFRYFMAPAGIIPLELLPEKWGLIEVAPDNRVRVAVKPQQCSNDKGSERTLLISALRRIGQNPPHGVSVKCYTIETKRTATIGLAPTPKEKETKE